MGDFPVCAPEGSGMSLIEYLDWIDEEERRMEEEIEKANQEALDQYYADLEFREWIEEQEYNYYNPPKQAKNPDRYGMFENGLYIDEADILYQRGYSKEEISQMSWSTAQDKIARK